MYLLYCQRRLNFFKIFLKYISSIGFHFFPLSTFLPSTTATQTPFIGSRKITNINARTFLPFQSVSFIIKSLGVYNYSHSIVSLLQLIENECLIFSLQVICNCTHNLLKYLKLENLLVFTRNL